MVSFTRTRQWAKLAALQVRRAHLPKTQAALRRGLAWFCIAAVFIALLTNARPLVDRTALALLDTTVLTVQYDGQEDWYIPDGMDLCVKQQDLRAALKASDPICNQFQNAGSFKTLRMVQGDELEIRVEPDGSLIVRIVPCKASEFSSPDGADCAASSPAFAQGDSIARARQVPEAIVHMSAEALSAAGPLPLSGRITVGRSLANSGSPEFLEGGTYEIREQSVLGRYFGRRSIAIERGEIIPGSTVNLLSNGSISAHSKGHFFLAGSPDQQTMRVVAVSEKGNGAIRMSLHGVEDIDVDPDWIDSVIANPIFFALAFLVGLFLNMLQLVAPIARKEPGG